VITLTLPYPISSNRYWRPVPIGEHITIVPTKEAKEYKATVGWLARGAGVRAPIKGRVHIDVKLYPHRPQDWKKRQREHGSSWDDSVMCIDLDNANKVLLDALKGVAIEDDKWVRRLTAERMEPDGREACVVVTITAAPVEQPQAGLGLDVPAQPHQEAAEEPIPF
jgi:crossover junction endodeoxyribonuclease RusA